MWVMWQRKQIKIDDGNRMLYSITAPLGPRVSWDVWRKEVLDDIGMWTISGFSDILLFWGAQPPTTCQSFAMQRSNGHCFNVCVLAGRGKGLWFRCHWSAKMFMDSDRKVLCTKYPLHDASCMVHDCSKLLLYIPYLLGECINISGFLSRLETNKNTSCLVNQRLSMRTLFSIQDNKIDQSSLWVWKHGYWIAHSFPTKVVHVDHQVWKKSVCRNHPSCHHKQRSVCQNK